jgi:hypothetical protein
MKKPIPTLIAKTKIRLDLLLDTSKDSLLLVTPFKTALIIALLTHHAIYSRPMLTMQLMELEMDFADFSMKVSLDAILLLPSV